MHRLNDGDIGKRTETYSIRIPENLHQRIAKLSDHWKRRMANEILIAMARIVHEAEFDPTFYLKDD